MARKLWARESGGLFVAPQLLAGGAPVDMTGWTLKASFTRQRGTVDVTLNMAATPAAEGFYLTNAPLGQYQCRILPATLQAIPDSTGDFTMFGDLLATQLDGTRLWIEDWEIEVTEGPTT